MPLQRTALLAAMAAGLFLAAGLAPAAEGPAVPAAAKASGDAVSSQLQATTWVLDGKADAPRVIYTFTDPNCKYCHKFWEAARPWVDAGKVQLRHILVGVIRDDSPAKAASILQAADRPAALLEHEKKSAQGGIAPAFSVSADVRKTLEAHRKLMMSLGFRGTPGIVVLDGQGGTRSYGGMPREAALPEVFGTL
jgi:thiol:disulfide interchange protein DsbG